MRFGKGVPVVTIAGNDWRGRSTAAVLAGCGLESFITKDIASYMDAAIALAENPKQLIDLRAHLNRKLKESPQWQFEIFTRNFESILRIIWHDWLHHSQ
jgi:protein O-GlcNAc transferase